MKRRPWWFPLLVALVFAVWMLDPGDVTVALAVLVILWWINHDEHRPPPLAHIPPERRPAWWG